MTTNNTSHSTPHIAPNGVPIAETVLLPGDPLRAKHIAETFLDNVQCFNTVRNMLGFTGTYRGQDVSVMGTGMGIPSISLYSYELIHFFGAKRLIRVGSCGALQEHINLYDLIIAQSASTDSNYLTQFGLNGTYAPTATFELVERAKAAADAGGHRAHIGNILSSDIFYPADEKILDPWHKMGILAVEMESAGLYANAAAAGVQALGLFAVSDNILTHATTSASERQSAFTALFETALELI